MSSPLWDLVFYALVAEMSVLAVLVSPIPQSARRAVVGLVRGARRSPVARYAVTTTLLMFALLFWNSVAESRSAKRAYHGGSSDLGHPTGHLSHDAAIRMFRAQRNAYITGFAIFVLFVLWRVVAVLGAAEGDAAEVVREESEERAPVGKKKAAAAEVQRRIEVEEEDDDDKKTK